MDLFSAHGYDETTTDEIAEAAGVSPRTFFRYFPTKESVLFSGRFGFIDSVSGVYLAQYETLSDYDALAESFALLAPGLKRIRHRIAQYREAITSSSVLLGRERQNHIDNIETVAEAIAQRRGLKAPDADCGLLAAVSLLLLERAVERWLSAPGLGLDDLIRAEFSALPIVLT
jgi:AcrR family transcriptional regulator